MSPYLFSYVYTLLCLFLSAASAFNNPSSVQVWCGKAYRPENASFSPGGWLEDPTPSSSLLLDLKIRPRMNLYLASDTYGTFIIDAPVSYLVGESYDNTTISNNNLTAAFNDIFIEITVDESGLVLRNFQNVTVNSTSNEFVVDITKLAPRLEPYSITVVGASSDGAQSYVGTTQLFRLPDRSDGGSVVKLDTLYGGIMVPERSTNCTIWTPIFPYSFYVSWGGYLNESLSQMNDFQALGYNMIHVVPDGGLDPFPWNQFDQYLTRADEIGLWVMYDMRWTYQNHTAVADQVKRLYQHPSLLLWYTGDEPDGNTDPLNATSQAYDLIKSIDPYHPVSLCLNCYNFYYQEYSSGADIILSDVYPISVNTSFSTQYDTVCNTTYGCCGCDDCEGNLEDISDRLDLFAHYDEIIGWSPKTKWGVPMAFGKETFWSRYPTADEEVVMNMLSVNHNAKAIVMWDFPTTPDLENATSRLAQTLTRADVTSLLLGASLSAGLDVAGQARVDAAAWVLGTQMLVSMVNLKYADSGSAVHVNLPTAAKGIREVLWGSCDWTVGNGTLSKAGLQGLEVSLLMLDL